MLAEFDWLRITVRADVAHDEALGISRLVHFATVVESAEGTKGAMTETSGTPEGRKVKIRLPWALGVGTTLVLSRGRRMIGACGYRLRAAERFQQASYVPRFFSRKRETDLYAGGPLAHCVACSRRRSDATCSRPISAATHQQWTTCVITLLSYSPRHCESRAASDVARPQPRHAERRPTLSHDVLRRPFRQPYSHLYDQAMAMVRRAWRSGAAARLIRRSPFAAGSSARARTSATLASSISSASSRAR
ncbi:hypothetical protein AWB81_01625 [Caballeronia arationis]|nr:hypothetical protein AWB81_01625 [Caballeronia arationis]